MYAKAGDDDVDGIVSAGGRTVMRREEGSFSLTGTTSIMQQLPFLQVTSSVCGYAHNMSMYVGGGPVLLVTSLDTMLCVSKQLK